MISVPAEPESANKHETRGLSVRWFDLSQSLGLATYRGPSLSRRGILGPGPIHPDQGSTCAKHPTYLTSEGEAEPLSLNIPVQKTMIPVISHLLPQYQQASTWEWELQFRTVTPLGFLEPHDRGGTEREGTHSTSKQVQVIMGPNASSSQVSVDDSLSLFLIQHPLNVFKEPEHEHRQGVVHQRAHLPCVMYKQ